MPDMKDEAVFNRNAITRTASIIGNETFSSATNSNEEKATADTKDKPAPKSGVNEYTYHLVITGGRNF
jgi:hypothetical protein